MKYRTRLAFLVGLIAAGAAILGYQHYQPTERGYAYIELDPTPHFEDMARIHNIPRGAEFWYTINDHFIGGGWKARSLQNFDGRNETVRTRDFRSLAEKFARGEILNFWEGGYGHRIGNPAPELPGMERDIRFFAVVEEAGEEGAKSGDLSNDLWGILYVEYPQEENARYYVIRTGCDAFPLIPGVSLRGHTQTDVVHKNLLGLKHAQTNLSFSSLSISADVMAEKLNERFSEAKNLAPNEVPYPNIRKALIEGNGLLVGWNASKFKLAMERAVSTEAQQALVDKWTNDGMPSLELSVLLMIAGEHWKGEHLRIQEQRSLSDVHMHHLAGFKGLKTLDLAWQYNWPDSYDRSNTVQGGAELRPLESIEELTLRCCTQPLSFVMAYTQPQSEWHSGPGGKALKRLNVWKGNFQLELFQPDFSYLESLEVVSFEQCQSCDIAASILSTLPNLKRVELKDNFGAEPQAIAEIFRKQLPSVEIVALE